MSNISLPSASTQMADIQAMLESGHKSVRLEKHSLILWGLAVSAIILIADWISLMPFETGWHRFALINIMVITTVAITALLDFMLTQRIRARRSQSISFVQTRLTRLFWLLAGFMVVTSFTFDAFGTATEIHWLIHPMILAATGIGLYAYGMFSRQSLRWAGIMLMVSALLGLLMVFWGIWPLFRFLEPFTASVFGIGLPLLAFLVEPETIRSKSHQILVSLLWFIAVLAPVFVIIYSVELFYKPKGETISLAQYQSQFLKKSPALMEGEKIVALPAGMKVAVNIRLFGKLIEKPIKNNLHITLSQPVLVALTNGLPDGRVRIGNGIWQDKAQHGAITMRTHWIASALDSRQGPLVKIVMEMIF